MLTDARFLFLLTSKITFTRTRILAITLKWLFFFLFFFLPADSHFYDLVSLINFWKYMN